jgi:hypothetical protein
MGGRGVASKDGYSGPSTVPFDTATLLVVVIEGRSACLSRAAWLATGSRNVLVAQSGRSSGAACIAHPTFQEA